MDPQSYFKRSRSRAGSASARRRQIYIGLDFGTTFAKVAYEVAPTTEHLKRSVRFTSEKNGYFIPTQLYFSVKEDKLSFFSEGLEDCSVVRFFKYSMVVDGLEKNPELNSRRDFLRTNPERLCSAYYLACLITIVRKKICEKHELTIDEVDWYVNMGVPVGKTSGSQPQVKPIYDEVLQVAWAWANGEHSKKTTIALTEFDMFYAKNRTRHVENLQTIPELYAEVLAYQQDNNIPEGFYAVVDIGGGTVDMAVFLKEVVKGRGAKVYCIAHEVSSEGLESIVSNVIEGDFRKSRAVRNCLLNRNVNFNILGDVSLSDERIKISYPSKRLIQAIRNFKKSYGECLLKARDVKIAKMLEEVKNGGVLRYFLMGGGKDVSFYNQLIKRMIELHGTVLNSMVRYQQGYLRDYIKNSVNLECKDDDRLLISQMLAQPYDNIPQLDGVPWDFVPSNKQVGGRKNFESYTDEMEDRMRELYGDV